MPTPPAQPPGDQPGARPRGSRQSRRRCARVAGPPLPDPAAVRLRAVPDSAPPYDDELAGPAACVSPPAAAHDRLPAAAGRTDSPGHRTASPGQPALPGQFAQVLVETLAGTRPPRQLSNWTTERARSRIQRMGPVLTAGQRPQLRRVVARQPSADVIEMTVVLSVGPRIRVLAVRLEHTAPRPASPGRPPHPGKWLCTDVEAA